MTHPEAPEPSNADLLAFMQQAFAHLSTEIGGVKADVAEVRAELAGVTEELRGEIRAGEARLSTQIGDVQRVVRTLKADLARHIADPDDHRRAA